MMFDAVILSPNSAIDSYYRLNRLNLGAVNLASSSFHTAGGKGINLSRALKLLGGTPFCLGLAGGEAGRFITKTLDQEEILHDFVCLEEENRRCNTLYIEGVKDTTVILENGPEIDSDYAEQLSEICMKHAKDAPYLVLTGSLPVGFPQDFYANIVAKMKTFPTKVCVDCSGISLKLASDAGAAIIKVNRKEFESAYLKKEEVFSLEAGFEVSKSFEKNGLEILVVTDGSNGAYIFNQSDQAYHVSTYVESWVSSAGAGDTFLAAMIYKLNQGSRFEDVFTFASAAAVANMQELGCGILSKEQIPLLLSATSIKTLTVGVM